MHSEPARERRKEAAGLVAVNADQLGPKDFRRLAAFINSYSGIQVNDGKKTMIEGRLSRRLRALGITRFADYCRYVFDEGGLETESIHLIDAITTNKTEFFREPVHFNFLEKHALPELVHRQGLGGSKPLTMWSAASSNGAEAYTLAMVAAAWGETQKSFGFHILGTDICTTVLENAVDAIYPSHMFEPVPEPLRRRFTMRSKDPKRDVMRIVPELRKNVSFGRLNLMDQTYPLPSTFAVIFCRNILIYFDTATQRSVLERLCRHLMPGGYLFLGHSESLTGFQLPLRTVANTVYQKL